jgi:F-type H+-transporting ATPase subunit delta
MADLSTVARPYAKALFDLANAERKLGEWSTALAIAAAVVTNPDAKRALANPKFDDASRAALVGDIAGDVEGGELLKSKEGRNLLRLLAENDRLTALPEISAQFDELKAEAENKVNVTITAAAPVDDALAGQFKQALERKLGRAVELTLAVDPSLIGGAVIQADDMVIDGSVRTRLQRLAEKIVG